MKTQPSPTKKSAIVNRLSVAAGHLNGIKTMIAEGREFEEVLTQLTAVKAEIESARRIYVKDYLDRCVSSATKPCDKESVTRLKNAIDKLL